MRIADVERSEVTNRITAAAVIGVIAVIIGALLLNSAAGDLDPSAFKVIGGWVFAGGGAMLLNGVVTVSLLTGA